MDGAGSVNCASATHSTLLQKIISPIVLSVGPLVSHLGSRPSGVCHGESDVGMEMSPPALLKPAVGQSIKAVFEYSHGSANRMKEKAAAAVMPNPSK